MSLSIVTKPKAVDFTRNAIFFRLVASTDGNFYDDYHVRAIISVENLSARGTYFQLPEFRLDPDNDGLVDLFDIGDIIKRKFDGYFDLPDWGMTAPVKTLATVINYNVLFREMDGTTEISTLSSGTYKALNGRVNAADHPTFDMLQYISFNKSFLNNSPARIYTHHGAKHYLYYLNAASDAVTITLKMEAQTKTGFQEYASSPVTLQSRESCLLPVGDIVNTNYGTDAIEIKIWIENAEGTTLAGDKYFQYSQKRLYAKSFLFQNRFGVFDTLTTQVEENSLNTERSNSRKNLTPGYQRLDGNMSSDLGALEDIFEAETGAIPIQAAQHYKEMMESEAIFLQTSDRWVKVKIEAGSFRISDESDDLQNVSFQYRPAFAGDMLNSEIKLPQPTPQDYSSEYLKTDYQ